MGGEGIILQVTSIPLHLWSCQSGGELRLVKLNLFSDVVETPPAHQYHEDAAGEHSTQMQQVTALSTGPAQEGIRLQGFLYHPSTCPISITEKMGRLNSCLHQNPLVGCLLNCPYGLDIEGMVPGPWPGITSVSWPCCASQLIPAPCGSLTCRHVHYSKFNHKVHLLL